MTATALKEEVQAPAVDTPSAGTAVTRGESRNGMTRPGSAERSMVPQTPIELLSKAMDMNLPPEELAKFMELYRQMEADAARKEFFAAFAAFQKECPSIKRTATAKITTKGGSNFGYTFAPIDEIARTANPFLSKNGLSYSWDTTTTANQVTKVCTLRHAAGHFITATCALPIDSGAGMSEQQKVISAGSFAERKSLSAVLGLTTTDEDNDGAAADVDPTPITEDQATVLADLIQEKGVNIGRFLKFMKAEKLSEIRAADFRQALTALEQAPAKKAEAST